MDSKSPSNFIARSTVLDGFYDTLSQFNPITPGSDNRSHAFVMHPALKGCAFFAAPSYNSSFYRASQIILTLPPVFNLEVTLGGKFQTQL